jgi:hypothetical protein
MLVLVPVMHVRGELAAAFERGGLPAARDVRQLGVGVERRRPVAVIGGEHSTVAENSRDFCERSLRLHPVQRLRAGDYVRGARRETGRGREPIDEANVAARKLRGAPRRLLAHVAIGLYANDVRGATAPQ